MGLVAFSTRSAEAAFWASHSRPTRLLINDHEFRAAFQVLQRGTLATPATEAEFMTTLATSTHVVRSLRLFAIDFMAALLVFAVLAGAFSVTQSNAFPAPPPLELTSAATAVALPLAGVPALLVEKPAFPSLEAPSSQHTMWLLAIAFATLTAFNMAVWRHLRTAYASPRRRS
jgi:hypothetical protein